MRHAKSPKELAFLAYPSLYVKLAWMETIGGAWLLYVSRSLIGLEKRGGAYHYNSSQLRTGHSHLHLWKHWSRTCLAETPLSFTLKCRTIQKASFLDYLAWIQKLTFVSMSNAQTVGFFAYPSLYGKLAWIVCTPNFLIGRKRTRKLVFQDDFCEAKAEWT